MLSFDHFVVASWINSLLSSCICYAIRVPPPHLSPFVDNDAEGYVPEYAETIKQLQANARNQVLPLPGVGNEDSEDPQTLLAEGVIDRAEANEAAERKQKVGLVWKGSCMIILLKGVTDSLIFLQLFKFLISWASFVCNKYFFCLHLLFLLFACYWIDIF